MRGRWGGRPGLAVLLLALCLPGCSADAGADAPQRTTTVFAAASLTEVFTRIARDLEADEPGTAVVLNFGASSSLARQVASGAPADVLAVASPATMATAVRAGAVQEPQVFARNTLQLAVPADATDGVTGLADLADPDRVVALCAPEVPCGAAATEVLAAAGVTARPDTLEQDVKAALSKVRLGEVDAALVYRTDVLAAGDEVRGIDVPEAATAVNDYLLAPVADSPDADGARRFVQRVLSEEGQRVLADAGFDRP